MLKLFNNILETEKLPISFKTSRIVAIPKQENYRPIALYKNWRKWYKYLCCVYKPLFWLRYSVAHRAPHQILEGNTLQDPKEMISNSQPGEKGESRKNLK